MQHTPLQSLMLGAALVLACFLTGCGPNAFVDTSFDSSIPDPRENLRLVAVDARVSSGSVELRRIRGSEAIFLQDSGILELNGVVVDSLTTSGSIEGITRAGTALAFLKNQDLQDPRFQKLADRVGLVVSTATQTVFPSRNDIAFAGGVSHRYPNGDGNRLGLDTQRLQWEQANRLFRAPNDFTVRMGATVATTGTNHQNPPPMILRGSAFVSTANMTRWNVVGGTLATGAGADQLDDQALAAERRRLLSQFETVAAMEPPAYEPLPPLQIPYSDAQTTASAETSPPVGSP